MYTLSYSPAQGSTLDKLCAFLCACGLDYDPAIRHTVLLLDEDEIIATGSLDGATIKCVAVSPRRQGEDLASQVMTLLMQTALQNGHRHLMLYTKPHNQSLFQPFGFHPVIRTPDCLLMENRANGLADYLDELKRPASSALPIGCIVANGDPFTLGHRYLVETAAAQCAWVHLFILSENRGRFSPETRLAMAKAACADLGNVLIHLSGPYMVSSATFPTYFIKDKQHAAQIHCTLDVRLFGEKIAPALRITRRYVGTEPLDTVTAQYNACLKELLPAYGISLFELPRKTVSGRCISASYVRTLLHEGERNALLSLLPQSTLDQIDRE